MVAVEGIIPQQLPVVKPALLVLPMSEDIVDIDNIQVGQTEMAVRDLLVTTEQLVEDLTQTVNRPIII